MSYTRNYSKKIPYKGEIVLEHKNSWKLREKLNGKFETVATNVASENIRTITERIPYEGYIDVDIDLTVDTNPFDSSVADCSNSVRNLNGAVIAMNSAQVASITKSADEVSSHVITGFFNMIGSELSQNMSALAAKFKAVFELLTSKSATLEKQQLIMQDDYSRVSDRYNKIFQNLDEELEKRVVALDKNVFEISKRVQGEQLHSETSKKITQFLIGVNEDEIIQQQLIIANAKARVLQAMDGLAANVVQETVYSKKLQRIVTDKNCTSGEDNFIPVIYTESSSLNSDMMDYNCYSNPTSKDSVQKINETVKSYFVSNYSNSITEEEKKQIDNAFTLIAEREFQDLKDEKSIRVYEVLKKLNAQEDFSSYEKKYEIDTNKNSLPKKSLKSLIISLLVAGIVFTGLTCFAAFKYAQSTKTYSFSELVKLEAKKHDASIQFKLGLCYYNGDGVSKDLSKAVVWWQKAADQGNADAQYNLGYCYENGIGVSKDLSKTVEWYQKAAEQGNARAQFNLGVCYYNGDGVSKDLTKAAEWWQKAADQGHVNAQFNLGYCYENVFGVSKDLSKAVEWYQKAADQGHTIAQFNLGVCYYNGDGVSKDLTKAAEWWQKAADQDDVAAQFNLGVCYENGLGVSKDLSKAVEWYQKAAEQGDAGAQFNLGICYCNGDGVSKDLSKAVIWYQKAAEQGHAEAQCNLGECYEYGNGVSKDLSKAVEWYQKAAEQDHANAQYSLGYCYENGLGVSKDLSKAVMWYQKAAEQGHANAQCNLGFCYEYGEGVSKDLSKAVEWYQKATEQGHASAQEALDNLKYRRL